MKIFRAKTWLNSQYGLIVLLWSILTLINLDKAYHIDDTFHLEAANCIKENPLKPMSGCINWGDSPSPIYEHNQPPLLFYLISLAQLVFGESEIIMHLLLSIFTLLSLIYFNKLLFFLDVKHKNTIISLFAFCPAFIVNQNLMTDVPVLAIALASMYYLLRGLREGDFKNYMLSGLLLSAGLLIKYTLIPLFFVILISILFSKHYKKLIVLFIPLFVLLLWSVWNIMEFNFVHILDRPKSGINTYKIFSFLGTLGSVSFFSVVYIYYYFSKKITVFFILFGFILFALSAPLVYFGILDSFKFNSILNFIFICNGSILMGLISIRIIELLQKGEYFRTPYFPVSLFILGFSAFIGIFAPFNATRHILLLIPFLILFGHKQFEKSYGLLSNFVLTFTIIVGVLLGISDWVYADFYRKGAKKIEVKDKTVWSIGHWGWQWYSKKQGMKMYSKEDELNVRNGDFIVFPGNISKQSLSDGIDVDTIDFITDTPDFRTFFSGKSFASMYNSYRDRPSWQLSNMPIDTIFICRVNKEIGIEDIIASVKSDSVLLDLLKKKTIDRRLTIDSILTLYATRVINEKRTDE